MSALHYVRLVVHRKWLALGIAAAVSIGVFLYVRSLPDIYTSETLILVDPQKVPESYVRSTVTGDVRNRLGTLSQQILSATRLQKIIDSFNLYPEERKTHAREDVITRMRTDIRTAVASEFGGSQDLQAFRISYRGENPRIVAQVTNQLAALFIEENLKAREAQATGTTEFLGNQLQETRKVLEAQESKLRDFKLRHLGEMPEQQTANLQILGQLQAQLQLVNESIGRSEQQKSMAQSMIAQGSPAVLELDDNAPQKEKDGKGAETGASRPVRSPLELDRERLQTLLSRYTENHPDVQKLKIRIAQAEAAASNVAAPAAVEAAPVRTPAKRASAPAPHYNPVLQAQMQSLETEIAKQREEQQRLTAAVAGYRRKVEAIPVREQEIAQLQRDYEMSKAHYAQLLDKQLSAQTATQLEIRQKGEKFTVLDPAIAADRPTSPNRPVFVLGGVFAGIMLGLFAAISTEITGSTIIDAGEVSVTAVLGVVPMIRTRKGRKLRRMQLVVASASALVLMGLAVVLYLWKTAGSRL